MSILPMSGGKGRIVSAEDELTPSHGTLPAQAGAEVHTPPSTSRQGNARLTTGNPIALKRKKAIVCLSLIFNT